MLNMWFDKLTMTCRVFTTSSFISHNFSEG